MTATTETPAAPLRHKVRPFYWSVRRELWENRAVYLAPLAVAAVILLAFLYASHGLPREVRIANGLPVSPPPHVTATAGHRKVDPVEAASFALAVPYFASAFAMLATTVAVGVFYILGALYGERRDRTVLFWKSLPVSDLTTVLSKGFTPLVILPLAAIAATAGLHLLLLGWSLVVLAAAGLDPGLLLPKLHLDLMWALYPYAVVSLALWWTPVMGWLLVVSAWAKRMTFLWAVAPPAVLCLFERLAFGTGYAWSFLRGRLVGDDRAFAAHGPHAQGMPSLADLHPLAFLADPGLWGGFAFAAACLAASVWLRRRRDPI